MAYQFERLPILLNGKHNRTKTRDVVRRKKNDDSYKHKQQTQRTNNQRQNELMRRKEAAAKHHKSTKSKHKINVNLMQKRKQQHTKYSTQISCFWKTCDLMYAKRKSPLWSVCATGCKVEENDVAYTIRFQCHFESQQRRRHRIWCETQSKCNRFFLSNSVNDASMHGGYNSDNYSRWNCIRVRLAFKFTQNQQIKQQEECANWPDNHSAARPLCEHQSHLSSFNKLELTIFWMFGLTRTDILQSDRFTNIGNIWCVFVFFFGGNL